MASTDVPGSPPHPFAIPVTSHPSYNGHYYAGSFFSGPSATATGLGVTIGVPDDSPGAGNSFYYVLLSAWDDAGSYDQIGFTDYYGSWEIAYSTSSPLTVADECPTSLTYYYTPDAAAITSGQAYSFGMQIFSGTVDFTVADAGSGEIVWSAAAVTGGDNFLVESTYTCATDSFYGYTDYEEVYDTLGPNVPYDLFFTNDTATPSPDGGYVTAWGTFFESPPTGVSVLLNGGANGSCDGDLRCNVTIANEPYYLYFTDGLDTLNVEPTGSPAAHFSNVTVADLTPDGPIYLSPYRVPAHWTVTLLTTQGTPNFTAELSVSFPSTAKAGSYEVGINATDRSGSYDRVTLGVELLAPLSASVSVFPGSGEVDAGQWATFSATAGGGSGLYSYRWSGLPLGCAATDVDTILCAPSSAGTSSIAVTVTDSAGYAATGTATYTVDTDPTVGLPTALPGSVDVGQQVGFTVVATGGSGTYTVLWLGLPGGCGGSSGDYDPCIPAGAGNFSIGATVTDSNGFGATGPELPFEVYAAPSVTLDTTAASVSQYGSVTFEAIVLGGAGGLTYAWNGLPAGCAVPTGANLTCSPTAAGTYEVTVTVTDQNGGHGESTVTLTVSATFLGLPVSETYGVVTLVVAVIVVLASVLAVIRRRRRPD